MGKKVGIVSLFVGQNFGNKLQNYAVEKLLERHGYIPYTFRYQVEKRGISAIKTSLRKKLSPSYIMTYIKIRLSAKIPLKNSDSALFTKLTWLTSEKQEIIKHAKQDQIKAYRKFDEQYLHFSDITISTNEDEWDWTKEFSYFVCGSDQVWNPYYVTTGKLCFLQFAPKEQRVALAPSFGVSAIPTERREEFAKWLDDIPMLSVREETGADIIRELTGREAEVLIDPTMCLTRKDWEQFECIPHFDLPDKYLLTYFLGDRTREYAYEIKRQADALGCEIVHLLDLMQPQYYVCSPNEFVWCIHHAQAICTDSFHASVFSIIYEKVFTTFERVEGEHRMSSRIYTLLESFNLQERLYTFREMPLQCNMEQCESVLKTKRERVEKFLMTALKEEM